MSKGANPTNSYNLRSKDASGVLATAASTGASAQTTSSEVTVSNKQQISSKTKVNQEETIFKSETKLPLVINVSFASGSLYESPQPSSYLDIEEVKSKTLQQEFKLKRVSSSPSLLEHCDTKLEFKSEAGSFEHLGESVFQGENLSSASSSSSSVSNLSSSSSSSVTELDSDSSGDMATNALMPVVFLGLHTEDAGAWIRDVENWCAYKKLDDAGRIGLMPLLLKGGARFWFDSLDQNSRATFPALVAAFREYYKRDESTKWRDNAEIWSLSQSPSQGVEEYIGKVQQLAQKAEMSEEQLRYSVIKGLLPYIRQSVLQHDPKNLVEVKHWSVIAESARQEPPEASLVEAVRRLEEKFGNMCTVPVQQNRQRSPSPAPRVRFAEDDNNRRRGEQWMEGSGQDQNSGSSQLRGRDYVRSQLDKPRLSSPYRQQVKDDFVFERPEGMYYNHARGKYVDNPPWLPQPRGGMRDPPYLSPLARRAQDRPGFERNVWASQARSQQNGQCFTCGSNTIHNRFNCPASGARCYNCSAIGHYGRVCRRGGSQYSNNFARGGNRS